MNKVELFMDETFQFKFNSDPYRLPLCNTPFLYFRSLVSQYEQMPDYLIAAFNKPFFDFIAIEKTSTGNSIFRRQKRIQIE